MKQSFKVIFEDNHLIVVNKVAGVLVQGDKTGDVSLLELVKKYIKEKYDKPGDVFLGTVHRIDRPVSGVVLFAKTSKALARLNAQFKEKDIQKTYWACVHGQPNSPEGTLINFLVKDQAKNKSRVTSERTAGAKKAELKYNMRARSDRYTLLEVEPKTGRHHQIRVQLSAAGFPIKGDLKYGAQRSNPDASIHLHARMVKFMHPVSREIMEIKAPPPSDAIWDHFARLDL